MSFWTCLLWPWRMVVNRALGILIFKGILYVMFMGYPQPGEDLKWKRAPSLPMQELSRRFGARSARTPSGSRDNSSTRVKEADARTRRISPSSGKPSRSSRDKLAHAEVRLIPRSCCCFSAILSSAECTWCSFLEFPSLLILDYLQSLAFCSPWSLLWLTPLMKLYQGLEE